MRHWLQPAPLSVGAGQSRLRRRDQRQCGLDRVANSRRPIHTFSIHSQGIINTVARSATLPFCDEQQAKYTTLRMSRGGLQS
jgi:hypothetical protein